MSSNVSLLNLNIQGSGDSHTTLDSAISCDQANEINIIGNHISDSLFGINFKQCNASVIKDNFITSKNVDLGLRGDAIRLWYSHDNIVENNHILKSRDMVIWYSSNNEIRKNIGEEGRYSLHFMYAGKNLVEDNIFKLNSVGIFFMFSSGSLVRNNQVLNSTGAFGVGIGMKDTSDFVIQNNILSYNARGLYLDQSPFQPGTINKFENNKILYNTVGVQFHATQHKSIFLENDFIGNMEVAINDTPGSKIAKNEWNKNYFDDYEGFDRNKDGIGDLPYQNYTYLDSLWQYHPNLRFFYGSSVISILNFIARLAPFSSPELLITDENPRIKRAYHE
ncbi:nitrous oxide reductase family maturation protein NosD, partial [Campylobacter fetus]